MSWWVSLNEKGELVTVDNFSDGGTYVVGGSTDANLNITYNYSALYHEYLDKDKGLEYLNRKSAKTCIPKLEKAVEALGTERASDYWLATLGNAGYALSILLKWAKAYPEALFSVS